MVPGLSVGQSNGPDWAEKQYRPYQKSVLPHQVESPVVVVEGTPHCTHELEVPDLFPTEEEKSPVPHIPE